jgi:hypothetical protein
MPIDSNKPKKWIDAAKILEANPIEKVICPECNIGCLTVIDEIIKGYNKLDRYLICDTCKKRNVLTMSIPEDYPIETLINTAPKM